MDIQYMPNYSWNDRLVLQLEVHTSDQSDIQSVTIPDPIKKPNNDDAYSTTTSQSTSFAREYRQSQVLSKLITYLNDLKERALIQDWSLESPTLEDVFLYHCSKYNQAVFSSASLDDLPPV
jgi:hypothetical protein